MPLDGFGPTLLSAFSGQETVASAQHWELGPIALGLIKRSIPVDAQLTVDGIAASQEVLVDPEIGLHFKAPKLGGIGKSLL